MKDKGKSPKSWGKDPKEFGFYFKENEDSLDNVEQLSDMRMT